MGYYDYHVKKFLKQHLMIICVLAIGSVVLLVPPEAWFPGVDFIPNFWQEKPLLFVLTEYQEAWFFLGIIALIIWLVLQVIHVPLGR